MCYIPSIGLEIHVQLNTKTKAFCGCKNEYGSEYNSQTCPTCMALPGALPVLNKEVVEKAVRLCKALNCKIDKNSRFDRKNYFYADLPKGYQITQFKHPIGKNGSLEFEIKDEDNNSSSTKLGSVRIFDVHMEEDTGKSLHVSGSGLSLVDINRAGVPLLEIVTEPDFKTASEVYSFLIYLRQLLRYLDISEANLEKGNMRCDVNISVRPSNTDQLGERTEAKNLNSFKNIKKHIDKEIAKQIGMLQEGKKVARVTYLWDEASETAITLRSKEQLNDYKYFPEPDLLQVHLSDKFLSDIFDKIEELPLHKKRRFKEEFGLSDYEASILTEQKEIALFFEKTLRVSGNARSSCNWIMGDLFYLLKQEEKSIQDSPITELQLGELIKLIDQNIISSKIAKQIFKELEHSDKLPSEIVDSKGLRQESDKEELEKLVKEVIANNQDALEKYLAGNIKLMGFFVGQIMKETQGKANPKMVNTILKSILAEY